MWSEGVHCGTCPSCVALRSRENGHDWPIMLNERQPATTDPPAGNVLAALGSNHHFVT